MATLPTATVKLASDCLGVGSELRSCSYQTHVRQEKTGTQRIEDSILSKYMAGYKWAESS